VEEVTLPTVREKVAEVEPLGTVTLPGTLATPALELDRDTLTPPLPAAFVKLTVPVADWPLTIVLGLTDTLLSATLLGLAAGGLTVTENILLTPE